MKKYKKQKEILSKLYESRSTYHNHKETMAHAAFAFQAALFGYIITTKEWPISWPENELSSKIYTFCVYFILWMITHIYIRWQLRNKRSAAIECATLLIILKKWSYEKPNHLEIKPFSVNDEEIPQKCKCSIFIDYIFVYPKSMIISDEGHEYFPSMYITLLKEKYKKNQKSTIDAEWLITYASIILCVLIFIKIFYFDMQPQ